MTEPELIGHVMAAGHLGGYFPDGDPDCINPDLFKWLVVEQRVRTVLDIGCGAGKVVEAFEALECEVQAVDGLPAEPWIVRHDYTTGPWKPLHRIDLGWSCEFVEHVEECFLANFLETFACCDLLLMTFAVPGQIGYHHVNCRTADYWVGALAAVGHILDEELTYKTRDLAAGWYAATGLAFRHVGS